MAIQGRLGVNPDAGTSIHQESDDVFPGIGAVGRAAQRIATTTSGEIKGAARPGPGGKSVHARRPPPRARRRGKATQQPGNGLSGNRLKGLLSGT